MILQACSECDRQYEVTHLAVGSRVRCICTHAFSVKLPKGLTVRAHECTNCGGGVEPGAEACSYCGAVLSKLDFAKSTLCPQCFTRLEHDAKHCKACGVAIEPQALMPVPEGRMCPRCQGELGTRSLPDTSVVECSACDGIWVSTEAFESICRLAQNRPEVKLHEGLEPIAATEPERKVVYVACLTCDELMQRKMFRYKNRPSRVVLDFCRNHGVWLDKDELERIVGFIRRRADVEMPFEAGEALSGGRRPAGGTVLVGSDDPWTTELGTFFLLGALGDVVGGILGEILD